MQKLIKYSFILFSFLNLSLVSHAKTNSREVIIHALENTWLSFDPYYEAYIPIQKDEFKKYNSIHQLLTIEKIKPYQLKFQAAKDLSLFINHRLVYKKISKNKEDIVLPLKAFLKEEKGEVIISFYHPDGQLPYRSAFIVNANALYTATNKEEQVNYLKVRTEKTLTDSLVLVFILIVTLVVLFRQFYPKEATIYFAYDAQEVNEHLRPSILSVPSLWVGLMVGLSLGLLIYIFKLDAFIWDSPKPIFAGVFIVAAYYFAFVFLKFLYTSLMAWLFNYSKLVALQNSEYIKLVGRVFFIAAILTYGCLASGFIKIQLSVEILYFSLILVLLLALAKVIFLFFRLLSHRNLYLFSYICAAEILPLVVAVKFLLF